MLSLVNSRHVRISTAATSSIRSRPAHAPRMRSSQRPAVPAEWTTRATYYFDAAWHTSQTFRYLLKTTQNDQPLGMKKAAELLTITMAAMLDSICPGFPDDADSLDCFHKLLQMHLSGLTATELEQLTQLLKAQRFDHVVIETVIDDFMLAEHGFTNGPPHSRQRTLMFTKDLHHALDQAMQTAGRSEAGAGHDRRLTLAQAQQARDNLAVLADQYARSGITLIALASVAQQLALATGTHTKIDIAVAAHPLPPASSISWQDGQLIVELHTLTALIETRDPKLHASVLRDLLELLLVHKLFGAPVDLTKLRTDQRVLLQREIEQILSRAPAVSDEVMHVHAANVLARRASFGTIQIFPTAGAMLGHAWISPVLSIVPDRSRKGVEAGKRFMRSGLRMEAAQCTVNEWDIRWLTPLENAELYPAEQAWHLTVPAHWLKLQQAATGVIQEWRDKALPYRFIGTQPGMSATGCRMTVWHAVQRAMDDDTQTLFTHFVRGLPEPESPTELALRLEQFMGWLSALAVRHQRGDL